MPAIADTSTRKSCILDEFILGQQVLMKRRPAPVLGIGFRSRFPSRSQPVGAFFRVAVLNVVEPAGGVFDFRDPDKESSA